MSWNLPTFCGMTSPYNWLVVVVVVSMFLRLAGILTGDIETNDPPADIGATTGLGLTVAAMLYVSCKTNLYGFVGDNTRPALAWVWGVIWRVIIFAVPVMAGLVAGGAIGEMVGSKLHQK